MFVLKENLIRTPKITSLKLCRSNFILERVANGLKFKKIL